VSNLSKPNPFAGILKAAACLPADTGAVAKMQRRLDNAGACQVILADVSASMAGASTGEERRIDVMRRALTGAATARLVAFSDVPREVDEAAALPAPSGGTALHLALDFAARLAPGRTLVVSDGEPDSEEEALAAADRVPGVIDVIYCGPASNLRAQAFLARLARAGGGRYAAHDITRAPEQLGPAVRVFLLGPGSGR
jgi:hypothetical protein